MSSINEIVQQCLWYDHKLIHNNQVFISADMTIVLSDNAINMLNHVYNDDGDEEIDDNDYSIDFEFDRPIYELDIIRGVKELFDIYVDSDYKRFGSIKIVSKRPSNVVLEVSLRQ